ncbi:hypothetical protein NHQ30_002300 [Ciborinia camelliae]|nr:hypothetical protein NHQ30_002300 [Ciborinia camelliae]
MARDIIHLDDCIWKDWLSAQGASLPRLDDVEQITNHVLRILGDNPGPMQLQGTKIPILWVQERAGSSLILENFLKSASVDLAYVLLSHWHGDHTGGVFDLIAFDSSLADRIYKHTPDLGQQEISDTQVFTVPGATVRAIYTPGHSTDHMCFVLEESALFTGDNVLGHGFSLEEDLNSYMLSLRRMKELGCTAGYLAHGAKIDDFSRIMDRYIGHKEQREQQLLRVLRRRSEDFHGLSVKALVHAVYGELPSDVVSMGLEPFVTQILWKLAEERKVGFKYVTGHRQWFLHKRFQKSRGMDE